MGDTWHDDTCHVTHAMVTLSMVRAKCHGYKYFGFVWRWMRANGRRQEMSHAGLGGGEKQRE